ncbi:Jag N-terminal domain-containing protein [Streptococcaceae bacterium ESL0687]|nr:Jag N-terminal domain-containing protein [Streptococcaceae bacterium ESL0687]
MTIFTGETVEKAIERGLRRLNVGREKVHISIVQHERKGFLGFGVRRARVDIEIIDEETQRRADYEVLKGSRIKSFDRNKKVKSNKDLTLELSHVVKAVRLAEKESQAGLSDLEKELIMKEARESFNLALDINLPQLKETVPEVPKEDLVTPVISEKTAEPQNKILIEVEEYLLEIISNMGIKASIDSSYMEDDRLIKIDLNSDQGGLLIGKHGKILQSLQVLTQAYASLLAKDYIKITIDVAGYLVKREVYLKSLARKSVEKALAGEIVELEDLQSHERKFIHNLISEEEGITSYSTGQDSKRSVIVCKENK